MIPTEIWEPLFLVDGNKYFCTGYEKDQLLILQKTFSGGSCIILLSFISKWDLQDLNYLANLEYSFNPNMSNFKVYTFLLI